jgi:hypothetical protein
MFSFPQNGLCRNCTVLKGRVMLLDANYNPVTVRNNSGVYIHHILTFDTTKRGGGFLSGCSSVTGMMGSKFIGSGEDNNNVDVWYTNKRGDHLGGFQIGASDRFSMNADLVSLNSAASRIYIGFDLEYLKGRVGSDSTYVCQRSKRCLTCPGKHSSLLRAAVEGASMPIPVSLRRPRAAGIPSRKPEASSSPRAICTSVTLSPHFWSPSN